MEETREIDAGDEGFACVGRRPVDVQAQRSFRQLQCRSLDLCLRHGSKEGDGSWMVICDMSGGVGILFLGSMRIHWKFYMIQNHSAKERHRI